MKTGFCLITLLLYWWVLPGAVSGSGIITGKGAEGEVKGSSLVIQEVIVKAVPVMRSSSEHFILEGVASESVVDWGEQEPGLSAASTIPKVLSLSQNYPNPFNPSTTINFDVPGELGEEKPVKLTIYDIRGRKVRTLVDSEYEPGNHRVIWDGKNERGQRVTSGVYLYTLRSEARTYTKKMVLVK
jgi:hypothetical protein